MDHILQQAFDNLRMHNETTALRAQVERLEAENTRLQAEVERLRTAGDQMIITWIDGIDAEGFYWLTEEVQKAWNAAKEGKQS
jgi:regulator of replication initiation timing